MCAFTNLSASLTLPKPTLSTHLNHTIISSLPRRQSTTYWSTPPQAKNTPHASETPAPRTQHNQQYTKVSIKTCTHHIAYVHRNNTQKHHSALSVSLPLKQSGRRRPPLEPTKQPRDPPAYKKHTIYKAHTLKTSHWHTELHLAPKRQQTTCQTRPIPHT